MGNGTEPRRARYKETSDLSFSAFVYMRGLKVVKAREFKRGGALEYKLTFDDPEGQWDDLSTEYVNSECSKYDASVRTLKRLCRRGNNGG